SCVGFLIVAFGAATPATSSVLPYTPLFRSPRRRGRHGGRDPHRDAPVAGGGRGVPGRRRGRCREPSAPLRRPAARAGGGAGAAGDRKSTRLNSSHVSISYAVFCLKKKTTLA